MQHNNGENKYARHVSGIQRTHLGGILQHTSVSKYFHKQFGCMDNVVEYCSGNLSHLKTQDCLRQIKFEVNSSNRFSKDMITDISATQEYYRNLLNEKPIPGYVQYFVKEPFIIQVFDKCYLTLNNNVQSKRGKYLKRKILDSEFKKDNY